MNSAYRQLVATYKTQQYYLGLYDNGANPEYRNALEHWTGALKQQARQLQVNVDFLPAELELIEEAEREAIRVEAEQEAQREAQREADLEARIALDYIDREAVKYTRNRDNYYIHPRRYQCILRHLWASWYIDTNRPRKWLEDLLRTLDTDAPSDYYYQLLAHRAYCLNAVEAR